MERLHLIEINEDGIPAEDVDPFNNKIRFNERIKRNGDE